MTLLNLLKKIEISDLKIIIYYMEQTLKMLDEFCSNSINKRLNYFFYYNLEIIKKVLQNFLDYVNKNPNYDLTDFTLNNKEELISRAILTKEIVKIYLSI